MEQTGAGFILLRLGLRLSQFLFSLLAFSLMAGAKQSITFFTGFTKFSTELHFSDYMPFRFLVATFVILSVWSLVMAAFGCVQLVTQKPAGASWRHYASLIIDTAMSFLAFGASCCAAGLTTVQPLFCGDGYDKHFCLQTKVAAAMGFLAWASLLPSFAWSVLSVIRVEL